MSEPQPVPGMVRSIRHALETNTVKTKGGCRLWLGPTGQGKFGRMWIEEKLVSTHRAAWFVERGEWPKPLKHRCGNRLCCTVEHLYLRPPPVPTNYGPTPTYVIWSAEADAALVHAMTITEPTGQGKIDWPRIRRLVEPAMPWLVGQSPEVGRSALAGRRTVLLEALDAVADQAARLANLRAEVARRRLGPVEAATTIHRTYGELGLGSGAAFAPPQKD